MFVRCARKVVGFFAGILGIPNDVDFAAIDCVGNAALFKASHDNFRWQVFPRVLHPRRNFIEGSPSRGVPSVSLQHPPS